MSGLSLGLPSLGLSSGPSTATQSGGNQAVSVNGAATLPASFWGTPGILGGTSIIPGLGTKLTTGAIFLYAAIGLGLWYVVKTGKLKL